MTWILVGCSIAALWIASTWLGGWVASEKARDPMQSYMLAFFFGLFGVLIVALLPNGSYQPTTRSPEIPEEDELEPDWNALGIKLPQPVEPPKSFTLPPPAFLGLRDQ
jgi:hypothetical protein